MPASDRTRTISTFLLGVLVGILLTGVFRARTKEEVDVPAVPAENAEDAPLSPPVSGAEDRIAEEAEENARPDADMRLGLLANRLPVQASPQVLGWYLGYVLTGLERVSFARETIVPAAEFDAFLGAVMPEVESLLRDCPADVRRDVMDRWRSGLDWSDAYPQPIVARVRAAVPEDERPPLDAQLLDMAGDAPPRRLAKPIVELPERDASELIHDHLQPALSGLLMLEVAAQGAPPYEAMRRTLEGALVDLCRHPSASVRRKAFARAAALLPQDRYDAALRDELRALPAAERGAYLESLDRDFDEPGVGVPPFRLDPARYRDLLRNP